MRRVLSTILAVALLLGLGALAVLALPNANASLAQIPAVSAAAPAFEPDAPAATFPQRLNMIALPLDASASFAKDGVTYSFDSKGLAGYIGPAVVKVSEWTPADQVYLSDTPPWDFPFPLKTGGVYMVTLNNADPTLATFSIVGKVPPPSQTTPQGATDRVEYNLVGASPACKLNQITVPLDRPDLNDSKKLATAIGNVAKIQAWNATDQVYVSDTPPWDFPFATQIGYPYVVCITAAGNGLVWP